jgi:hypothetical protein
MKQVKSKKAAKAALAKKITKVVTAPKKTVKVAKKAAPVTRKADDGYVCKGTHCWSGVEILCHGDECTD